MSPAVCCALVKKASLERLARISAHFNKKPWVSESSKQFLRRRAEYFLDIVRQKHDGKPSDYIKYHAGKAETELAIHVPIKEGYEPMTIAYGVAANEVRDGLKRQNSALSKGR